MIGFVGKIKWILPFLLLGLIIVSPCYAQWLIETLDDGGQPSIAVDSSGFAHVCYSQGGKLKYATNASGSWVKETVDSGGNIISSSIALGLNDEPHIVYSQYDSNQGTYLLKNTKKLNDSWQPVETIGEGVGGYWSISLAIDSNGKLHISLMVASGPASSGVLLYGTDASGVWAVDQLENAYDYAAMDIDIENNAHISFYSTALDGLAYMTNAPGAWQAPELVDSVGGQLEGMVTSIAAISRPHICYVGGAMEDNRYATKNPDGSWFIGNLDHGDFASAGNSIAIDTNGYAHVSYYHMASGELRYQSSAKGPMGVGHSMRVDSGGWSNAIAVDPSDIAHIGYGASGKIKYATPVPDISVSPESLDFGSVKVGTTSAPLEVTVSNNGLANLIIGSIDITGVNPGDFSQTNDCSTVAYDESCTVTVTFTPGSVCMKTAALWISSNDPDSPTVEVPLAGVGFVFENWAKTYGGSDYDSAYSIQPTSDNGYIVAGFTESFGAGYYDGWILKLDASGCVQWQKAYGGINIDSFRSAQQTADGGYMAAGNWRSFASGDVDVWILKLDAAGNIEWQKTYGGIDDEYSRSAQQTVDGGYIVAGVTDSFGWAGDVWILKLDASGDVEWQKSYGDLGIDSARSIQQTADGGYIVAAHTSSFGAGSDDVWILKLDASGNMEWQKTFGGIQSEAPYGVQQTADGGYITATSTISFGAGGADFWVLKLDANGNIQWQKTYGRSGNESARSIQQTADGGYIVAGFIDSGAYHDSLILKLDAAGNVEWQKTYGGIDNEESDSILQTADGGYIAAGHMGSLVTFSSDVWILKLDANGNISGCPQDLIGTLEDVSIDDTSATVEDTNDIPLNSSVSPQDSNASVEDTNIVPLEICSVGEDGDDDGVADTEEMGPDGTNANYDGNSDGIPDSQQENVASRHTHDGQHYVTLASPDGTKLNSVRAVDNPSPGDTPQGVAFPYGFFRFTVTGIPVGGSTTVTLYFPPGENPATYYKYGPTPDNNTPHWYEFLYDGQTGAEINGNVITLHFVDGKRGDHDFTANGIIVEPGAPALYPVTPGDLDGDKDIDLADAVLALQVLAGIEPSSSLHKGADVDGNRKIGMEEVVYILQTVSGMRAEDGAIGGLAGYKIAVTYHEDEKDTEKTWIEIKLVDEEWNPVPGERYKITLLDGKTVSEGTLDANGWARVEGIVPGTCQISFPDLDKDAWKKI